MAKVKKGDIIMCYENGDTTIYSFQGNAGGMKDLYNITDGWYESVPSDYFKGKEVKVFPHDFLEFLLKNQKEEFVKLQHPDGKDFPELNVCPICGKNIVVYAIWKLNPPYVNEMHYQIACCWCGLKLDKGLMVSPKELSEIWNRYSKKGGGKMKYKIIAIGIDQSYKNTGISIAADGVLKKVSSINLEQCKTKTEKRDLLKTTLDRILSIVVTKAEKVVCIIERVRLRSKGFLSLPYIQSMGALNAVIIDCSAHYGVSVFSVDTRCWKSRVVGTCSGEKNPFGVPENKYPTVKWVIKKGFESSILNCVKGRKSKGTFVRNGQKLEYDNDAADSAAIAMFYFVADKNKLKPEE